MNNNSQVVARDSHFRAINVSKSIDRLHKYEAVLLGNDDDIDVNIKNSAMRYAKYNNAPIIMNSLAIELCKNKTLHRANRYQFQDWIDTAIKFNFKFGATEKRIHILEFNYQPMMYFGYEAYQDIIERLYNIRLKIDVFTIKEVFDYYIYERGLCEPKKELCALPEYIPSNLRDKNIKSARDIFGFRLHHIDLKSSDINNNIIKTIDLDVSEYLPDWYIDMTKHKPFWRKYPSSMAKKRVLIEYIKEHIGLKDNEFLEMMNFELNQEKEVGLAN